MWGLDFSFILFCTVLIPNSRMYYLFKIKQIENVENNEERSPIICYLFAMQRCRSCIATEVSDSEENRIQVLM